MTVIDQATRAADRERLRRLVRTYGLKRIAEELGWNNDYLLSVLDGMEGCTAFWTRVGAFLQALSIAR